MAGFRVRRSVLPLGLVIATAIALSLAPAASTRPTSAASYLVVLKDGVADAAATARDHARRPGVEIEFVYTHALEGYAATLSAPALALIEQDPRVDFVASDDRVTAAAAQPNPPWGLDRIDQRALPLDNTYSYTSTGSDVTAYVVDTGIRFSHSDFGGRAVSGFDAVDGGSADDCNGHGTHVAGTIGGTTYGVAKQITMKAVRVLDCQGSGTTAQFVAGLDWLTGDHVKGTPAVANVSVGGPANSALDKAVKRAIRDGIVLGIAAGASGSDACSFSPGRVKKGLTVAASAIDDTFANFSNRGRCVDLIAPGVNIKSDWFTSDDAVMILSGTSFATPHVVGIAARAWSADPTATAGAIVRRVKSEATQGAIIGVPPNTPNKLAFWPATG
jgi:subtilisin family serine protease